MKIQIISGVSIYFFLIYSNYIVGSLGLSGNYSNPIFRMIEFSYGAIWASILLTNRKGQSTGGVERRLSVIISAGLIVVFITLILKNMAEIAKLYFSIPIISGLLYLALHARNEKLEKSKLLNVLGKISYHFFLTQLFLWKISAAILSILKRDSNIAKILISLFFCFAISILIYYLYDRPIQRIILSKVKK